MNSRKFGQIAFGLVCVMAAREGFGMDVSTIKDPKTKKEYVCANASCEGKSSCMGAGNDKCGSQNACAKTLGHPVGWIGATDQKNCESNGGKWLAYKKEYSIKGGNVPPLKKKK